MECSLVSRGESLDDIAARRGSLTEVQRRRLERGRGMLQTWLLAFIIVLYFVYPNLIQESSQMLRCEEIHYESDVPHRWPDSARPGVAARKPGTGRTERFLAIDKGINCGEKEYQYYRMLAIIFALGYGFGIPLLAAAIVRVAIMRKNFESASRAFGFLLMGYRQERWYWEAVVMVRKLAVVFIVVFIQNAKVQTYVGMWVVTLALIVHLWCRPYDSDLLINLEAFSLSIIIATLNLSLLYEDLEPLYEMALTLLLAIATLSVMLLFGYFLAVEGLKKAGEVIQKIRQTISSKAKETRKRVASAVQRFRKSNVSGEVPVEAEEAKLAITRMVTHASTLPNFDRLTLLSKLFVLRGGLSREDEFEWEDGTVEDEPPGPMEQPPERAASFHRPFKWQGIIAGDNTQHEPGSEVLREILRKHAPKEETVIGELNEYVIENLKADMGIGDNHRFTRKEAKTESIEGDMVKAAYMFCHLKPEGITTTAGISDKDAQDNIDNIQWGARQCRIFCKLGRGLAGDAFDQQWKEAVVKYY